MIDEKNMVKDKNIVTDKDKKKEAEITKEEDILEFDKIKNMLCEHAVSLQGKQTCRMLDMHLNEAACIRAMKETTQARRILDSMGTPPISSMKEIDSVLNQVAAGGMLLPEQLNEVNTFLTGCSRMKSYLKRSYYLNCSLSTYDGAIQECEDLRKQIESSIRNNQVEGGATPALGRIRREMEQSKDSVKAKLEQLMKTKKEYFADSFVSQRNGHYVLPVKKEYKNQISGTVYDKSSSGGTVFIEPAAVSKLYQELWSLEIEEENEICKILYQLTAEVEQYQTELTSNKTVMAELDFAFAKAKLSSQMHGIGVPITTSRNIIIKNGKHPLLEHSTCVPLNFNIGEGVRGVVITGPNTGGKTVSLKTVGLLSLMAQCGLHVPVEEGSQFCMHNEILCDMGDGQSLEKNLSTFSAHIVSVNHILKTVTRDSLVLLDELGSGTDPAEGMGIAIAILEKLRVSNCLFIATTHYPEVKEYAKGAKGLTNARMAFDRESLKPLYQLEIGEAGESCALYIAERLGFPKELLEIASACAYHGIEETDTHGRKKQMKDNGILRIESESQDNAVDFKEKSDWLDQRIRNQKLLDENLLNKKIQKHKLPEFNLQENSDRGSSSKRIIPKPKEPQKKKSGFTIGDSVMVFPQKEKGIVYQVENTLGEVGVQIKGKKTKIMHTRVKLLVPAAELYPEDYDFSIIFDSVENRKAIHQMNRKYDPDVAARYEREE